MARNLEMRCFTEGCDEGGPITSMKDWAEFVKHQKGHNPRLVDADTGEVLASTPNTVKKVLIDEGILEEKEPTPEEKNLRSEETPEETPPRDEQQPKPMLESTNKFAVSPDGETWFSVNMWLPSRAFDLFRLLSVNKLTAHTDPISMLVDYAERGVMAEHNLALTLAPVEMGDGSKSTDQLASMIQQVSEAVVGLSEEVQGLKGEKEVENEESKQ